jgi:hypothetical protein
MGDLRRAIRFLGFLVFLSKPCFRDGPRAA